MIPRLDAADRTRLLDLMQPPSEAVVAEATRRFVDAVHARYRSAVDSCHLFGSRARGTHKPDSDVDVVVVFRDASEPEWKRLRDLSGLAFDVLLDSNVRVEPHPMTAQAWRSVGASAFVDTVRREAKPLS